MGTVYTQPRQFFPALWARGNVPASASLDIGLAGAAYIDEVMSSRQLSVVALVLMGTAVPTTGWIKAEITKDGSLTGYSAQFGASTGTQRRVTDIAPGDLQFNKEHRIGIRLTSAATLNPTTIDVGVYVEVQGE